MSDRWLKPHIVRSDFSLLDDRERYGISQLVDLNPVGEMKHNYRVALVGEHADIFTDYLPGPYGYR